MPIEWLQMLAWHTIGELVNMKKIHIGTSGWHYKHWIGTFYPAHTKQSAQLSLFQQYFDTVEINNSFYRLPTKETFDNWKRAVPDDFLMVVKASRFITHMKKLKGGRELTATFFDHVGHLGEKLGPILFQLPPSWQLNEERLKAFLSQLPSTFRYVFEFRNTAWYTEAVYALLRYYNAAFCIYELDHHLSPQVVTANFVYIRLHGPEGKYQGNYTDAVLQTWADRCKGWLAEGKEVFVYFDNDQNGYAAFNALRLKALLGENVKEWTKMELFD